MPLLSHAAKHLLVILILVAAVDSSCALAAKTSDNFICGGNVEIQAWAVWDTTVKHQISDQLIDKELLMQGDTYALYNFQTYIHNLAAMAMRCERRKRADEISALVEKTYAALTPAANGGRQWICRGGAVCNSTNKLINKEVMLTSVQFLGLASQLSNWLATRPGQLSPAEAHFVRETAEMTNEHLLRWGAERERSTVSRIKASATDVKNGSSSLFYTDKDLWLLGIYADLAGIMDSDFGKQHLSELHDSKQKALLKRYTGQLMQLLLKRLTLEPVKAKEGKTVIAADLDRGFWRLYADSRYAGYNSPDKPVVCEKGPNGANRLKVLVPQQKVPIVDSIGWDLSHARRLVHVIDSVSRNRTALARLYGLTDSELPGLNLAEAFANQLAMRVWNGDREYPLFSNYWDGTNGWYRVAYDNGTGQCREGTPPYGLSNSFPTGGYVTWGRYVPVLGTLGQKIHTLLTLNDKRSLQFIETYYPDLSRKSSKISRSLNEIMFLPSLVGNKF